MILGVSYDTPEDNRAFAEAEDFPFRLLSDVDRTVSEAYETRRPDDHPKAASPRRFTYLVDPEGTVRKAYWAQDEAAHPGQVLEDLKTMRG